MAEKNLLGSMEKYEPVLARGHADERVLAYGDRRVKKHPGLFCGRCHYRARSILWLLLLGTPWRVRHSGGRQGRILTATVLTPMVCCENNTVKVVKQLTANVLSLLALSNDRVID